MTTTTSEKSKVRLPLQEAADRLGIDYETLRRKAVLEGEFTTIRDGIGRGFRVYLRRDEVEVYEGGGLIALRKFRVKKGRK